jgi:hypothetical protein
MVKRIDFLFLMKFTVQCTTSPWSPDDAGDSGCFCKQDSEINGVIVINNKTFGVIVIMKHGKRFIVKSVLVYSKVIGVIENGKDKWCFCKFP